MSEARLSYAVIATVLPPNQGCRRREPV